MSTDRARLTGTLAWGVVGVRGAVAAAFAAAPDRTMGELFGQDAGTTTRRWVARHYALRDAALGAGLAPAPSSRRGPTRPRAVSGFS
jgi:hypothetical protein